MFEGVPEHYRDLTYETPTYCFNRGLFDFVVRRLQMVRSYKMKVLAKKMSRSVPQQQIWEPDDLSPNPDIHFCAQMGRITSRTTLPVVV